MEQVDSFEFLMHPTVCLGAVVPRTWTVDCCKSDLSVRGEAEDRDDGEAEGNSLVEQIRSVIGEEAAQEDGW